MTTASVFMQGSTVHVEASWSMLVSWCALLITVYNSWLKREKRTKEEIEEDLELRNQVKLMWQVMFPAGISKALRAGILEKNSPLRWSTAALERHEALVADIRRFYAEECRPADDLKLLLLLSGRFEHEITKLVQDDPAYSYEAMLLSAFYLCRPESKLFEKYKAAEEDCSGQHKPG